MAYGLARQAAAALVRGVAGSVGRRIGGYRRRRRVTWPTRRKAGNVRRLRTYVKKVRVRGSSRNIRRLWRAVRALQRTSDPDVTFRDIVPGFRTVENDRELGGTVGDQFSYVSSMTNNLKLGLTYRIKSLNEQIAIRLNVPKLRMTTDSSFHPAQLSRHVRILYILAKDELMDPITDVFAGFTHEGTVYKTNAATVYPQLLQNPGATYRIIYDKTYTVRTGSTTNIMVRIPYNVFYDKGLVKFRQNSAGAKIQQNNYLYRVILADSIVLDQVGEYAQITADDLVLKFTVTYRWKYFDNGGSSVSNLSASLGSPIPIEDLQGVESSARYIEDPPMAAQEENN